MADLSEVDLPADIVSIQKTGLLGICSQCACPHDRLQAKLMFVDFTRIQSRMTEFVMQRITGGSSTRAGVRQFAYIRCRT